MRGFTATELANNTGDVLMAAAGGPIEITRHGKSQFVLMTQALYTQLLAQNGIDTEILATSEPVSPTSKPKVSQVKSSMKTAKKTKKAKTKKAKSRDVPEANANAALELMQALQSWSDD